MPFVYVLLQQCKQYGLVVFMLEDERSEVADVNVLL